MNESYFTTFQDAKEWALKSSSNVVTREDAESMVDSATKQKFDEIIRPGDELWEFTSSGQDWEYLAGQSGLSVIRNDEIIYQVITMMS